MKGLEGMFISFTIANAYSFYDSQTLSARAVKTCKERQESATFKLFPEKDERLVKTLAVYGANASGKSNIFYALFDMLRTVLYSASTLQTERSPFVTPFFFSDQSLQEPSTYTLEFLIGDWQYKYGYSATGSGIVGEYLVRKGQKGRVYKELFSRSLVDGKNRINIDKAFGADELVVSKTRTTALFLSTCALLAVPEAEKIVNYFAEGFKVVSADRMTPNYTSEVLGHGRYKDEIVRFLKMTDPGIGDIDVTSRERETGKLLPDGSKEVTTYFEPLVSPVMKNGTVSPKQLPLVMIASLGTIKAFNLSAHIFEALDKGTVLVLDELDSRLHPLLTKEIIRLFNSSETNPRNAQLIFNTHDTNLLGVKVYNKNEGRKVYLLRRDEIYFVEKNGEMCSRIYSLIDFRKGRNKVRNDASYEKDYLEGLYGAIPYIGKI